MFLDHTQRSSTVGRTPMDEWSARRRDLYLTTYDTHNRQISMPPVGFEPKVSAGERPPSARMLWSWVQIPQGEWIFVCCVCRVLSGRVLCDELITRPEDSYRMCCVVVCDLETSRVGAPYKYDISSLRVKLAPPKRAHWNTHKLLSQCCLLLPRYSSHWSCTDIIFVCCHLYEWNSDCFGLVVMLVVAVLLISKCTAVT